MKTVIAVIALVFFASSVTFSQSVPAPKLLVKSESSLKFDPKMNGFESNRLIVKTGLFSLKYDYMVDRNGKTSKDVGSITVPVKLSSKLTLLNTLIKVGDPIKTSEYFVDEYLMYAPDSTTLLILDLGQGMMKGNGPRSYMILRAETKSFTAQYAFLTKRNYSSAEDIFFLNYFEAAYHPEKFFIGIGNGENLTWLFLGTRNIQEWGSLVFGNYNDLNGNYWIRGQVAGFGNVNQSYFNIANYRFGLDIFTMPPFHYVHLGPTSTRGNWAMKVDTRKTGSIKLSELLITKQFGAFGQVGLGGQLEKNPSGSKTGMVIEYYNSIAYKNLTASVELKYVSLTKAFTSYITLGQSF